jgi:hypothetical protein
MVQCSVKSTATTLPLPYIYLLLFNIPSSSPWTSRIKIFFLISHHDLILFVSPKNALLYFSKGYFPPNTVPVCSIVILGMGRHLGCRFRPIAWMLLRMVRMTLPEIPDSEPPYLWPLETGCSSITAFRKRDLCMSWILIQYILTTSLYLVGASFRHPDDEFFGGFRVSIVIIQWILKVKLSLCVNWAPRHEAVLGEWRYSSTRSWPRH